MQTKKSTIDKKKVLTGDIEKVPKEFLENYIYEFVKDKEDTGGKELFYVKGHLEKNWILAWKI